MGGTFHLVDFAADDTPVACLGRLKTPAHQHATIIAANDKADAYSWVILSLQGNPVKP
jgi:hypothetical protein